MFLILTAFIIQCNGYQCPHYDNVHEIEDGQSEKFNKETIYSCNHDFKVRLHTFECKLLIFACKFKSIDGGSLNGGAILIEFDEREADEECKIEDCEFVGCTSSSGGAIYVNGYLGSPLTINNCLFQDNSVKKSYEGGALYLESCFPTIYKCRFIDNITPSNGMSIYYLYKRNVKQTNKTIVLTIENCYFSYTKAGSFKDKGVICLNADLSFTLFCKIKGTEIDISGVSDLSFLNMKSQRFVGEPLFENNYISPYEKTRFIGNLNIKGWDFEKNTQEYKKKPATPDIKYEGHKEDTKVEAKIEHTGSSEKNVAILVAESAFKDFRSTGDGGLFYLKDIDVDCHNNKITNCESANGAGGAMFIQNTNDLNCKVTISNIQFINCKADYGGALYIYSLSSLSDILIEYCTFKSNKAKLGTDAKTGGSAIYLESDYGKLANCEFTENNPGSAIKVVSPNKDSSKALSTANVNFYNCNFASSKDSRESIYFAGKMINVVKCNFKGKLPKGVNYIDGELVNNRPSVHLDGCRFEYKAINKKLVASSSLRSTFDGKFASLIFIAVGSVALVAIVTFTALKIKKYQREIKDDEDSEEKKVINESL